MSYSPAGWGLHSVSKVKPAPRIAARAPPVGQAGG
jgi:hypothetical protein